MSIPRIERFDKAERLLSLEEEDNFFLATENVRKELDRQLTAKFTSSRIGLRALQSLAAEKIKAALKQDQFSLPEDFLDHTFSEKEEVKEGVDLEGDSPSVANKNDLPQEDIENEDLLLSSDPELAGFFKGVRALESLYEEHMKFFKQFGEIQGLTFTGFEYGSANKDNIHGIASKFNPDKCDEIENSLDALDSGFKEMNCLVPFITQGVKYLMILYVQTKLEKYKQHANEMSDNTDSLEPDAYSINKVKNIYQKYVNQFDRRLEQHQKEIEKDVSKRKAKIFKAFSPLVSKPVQRWLKCSPKNAGKLVRHSVGLVATACEIHGILNAYVLQQEWISRLQPHFAVNVYSTSEAAEEPVLHDIETAQQKAINEVNEFLSFLKKCDTIEEVQDKFEEIGIPFEGPRTINEFQHQLEHSGRFSRFIVQSYYYYKGHGQMTINDASFKLILSKKEEEYNLKIETCLACDINNFIDACQNKGLAYTKDYFKQHHMDIDNIALPDDDVLPLPPQTEADWQQCIQSEEFCRALAKQLLDYHEALAVSIDLATRQTMLSKHAVEREGLIFRGVGNAIEFFSSVLQIGLLGNQLGLLYIGQQLSHNLIFLSASSALEMFLKDISKSGIPGIGVVSICYPLYPNVSLKLESLFLLIAEHFVNVKHKPNEYSFDGYMLAVQINALQFTIKFQALIYFCKQALLWLNIRLIENCIMHLKNKPFNEDPRVIQMNNRYQEQALKYKHYSQNLKSKINALKIKDAELTMCPQLEKVRAHLKDLQPLRDIAEKLDDTVNIDCFPSHIIESIEDYTGFRLTNANKQNFRGHLEELLTSSEADFIEIYKDYRLPHVKKV